MILADSRGTGETGFRWSGQYKSDYHYGIYVANMALVFFVPRTLPQMGKVDQRLLSLTHNFHCHINLIKQC